MKNIGKISFLFRIGVFLDLCSFFHLIKFKLQGFILYFNFIIVSLSVNIFSLYTIKQKEKTFPDIYIFFRAFLKVEN